MADLAFPRYVHGPEGAHRLVQDQRELAQAQAEGWQLSPILTPAQIAAVTAAQIAAGEIPDEALAPEPEHAPDLGGAPELPEVASAPEPDADRAPEPPKRRGRPSKGA